MNTPFLQKHREEQWKTWQFNFEFSNSGTIEVSNFGRVRTFNKTSNGKILNGAMVNGYRIIKLRLYKPRDEKTQQKFDYLQKQVSKLRSIIKELKATEKGDAKIAETTQLLTALQAKLSKKFKKDLKERNINHSCLVHRLVATYFLDKPTYEQTVVAHLDFDKLNNRADNLKWMTREENFEHQNNSPAVIKERTDRKYRRKEDSKATKLTVTKVMLLKKLLNDGKPIKQLVKQFKVTDTQILRIKRGENWSDIQPFG